jgi:hypothetical protein
MSSGQFRLERHDADAHLLGHPMRTEQLKSQRCSNAECPEFDAACRNNRTVMRPGWIFQSFGLNARQRSWKLFILLQGRGRINSAKTSKKNQALPGLRREPLKLR